MTWWSEHNAVPRLILAKLAIRCRFVDRFVGSRAPSRVSGQRFSPRGASLPSVGSRRARFPVFIGTTKALRLPARANLLPYGFGCRPHAPLLCSCIAEALLTSLEEARQAWNTWSAGVPCPACRTRGRVRDLTGFLATHPMPLPCSKTPAEPTRPRLSRSCQHRPRPTQTEGLSLYIISRLTQGFSIRCLRFTSDVAAAHARLASGWRAAPLPGGGRTLWIASKGFRLHPILLSRTSPVARVVYAKPPFSGPEAVLAYLSRYTHRVAISNQRLLAFDAAGVTFRYKDYRCDGADRQRVMTLGADEFIRRFLLHLLPPGFHRIRHYGLLSASARTANLARARQLLAVAPPLSDDLPDEPLDVRPPCPCCGGHMIIIETFARWSQPRAPPHRPNPTGRPAS
jgi:Putative transposase